MNRGKLFLRPGGYNAGTVARMESAEITSLLKAWAAGDAASLDRLTPQVYEELRRIAGHFMRDERPGRTIQTTALVHEAYLRLVDVHNVDWKHRVHFFAVSAQIMRHILVDAARKRRTAKRGGSPQRIELDAAAELSTEKDQDLVALDDALKELERVDPRRAKVIELRFFGGLSVDETAKILNVSADTIFRDWRLARAWLLAELDGTKS